MSSWEFIFTRQTVEDNPRMIPAVGHDLKNHNHSALKAWLDSLKLNVNRPCGQIHFSKAFTLSGGSVCSCRKDAVEIEE